MNLGHAVATFRGHNEPHFRIIEHRKWWFLLSGGVIALSIVGLAVRHLNLSIDFEGGSQLTYVNNTGVSAEEVQAILQRPPWSLSGTEVQIVGGNQLSVRTPSFTELSDVERTELIDALARQAGVSPSDISRTDVGPTWGAEISRKALEGLIVVLVAITLYIAMRFEWKMAVGAQVAMVHDVLITGGVYALTGREVTPATVIAILTILGYSLYDTVVIYDKIKENTESAALLAKDTYGGVVNMSLNQVFMRSVNTSLVVLFPIASLLLFGGSTLKDFAFAMMIGVISGAYSSIFVAAPILSLLKEREPKYAQLRTRATARDAAGRPLRPVPSERSMTAAGGDGQPVASAVGARSAGGSSARSVPWAGRPRPRPKKKRKRR
ncbi:MAG TPA: protein translocase subunit SecF [Actinomycetota bacterium]|nr:protein translocase subunit SecF [Actinomycetota bacterium]